MAVGDAYVFPGFLTPVLTLLFFQSHRLLFSHASAEVRGENTPERKVASTWDRTHNHQVMSPTRSPLSHPGGLEFLRISSCPYIVQEAPIHQSHVFWQIKISQTLFEKSHPRNILAKLFQNLTSGYGEEDFLRISSCPYSARNPHSPEPCLWMDQTFTNKF